MVLLTEMFGSTFVFNRLPKVGFNLLIICPVGFVLYSLAVVFQGWDCSYVRGTEVTGPCLSTRPDWALWAACGSAPPALRSCN